MSTGRIYSFYAYHGTTSSCAAKISATGHFIFGKPREDHWLGQGVYFFREDYDQAVSWARTKIITTPTLAGESPSVIEVVLEASGLNFWNLDTRGGLLRLLVFLRQLEKKGVVITGSSREQVCCFVLSMLPDEAWMIQRTFKVASKVFDGNRTLRRMELGLMSTQICVRNYNVIRDESIKIC